MKQRSNRSIEWSEFSAIVDDHIEGYTVPQYGDYPNDSVAEWSAHDCETQIKKYVTRIGSNQRGFDDQQLDLLKIAHYACLVYNKRIQEKEEK